MEEPAYRRVAGDLRRRITGGELAAGARIPSRSQLMSQYGVGEQTAVQAVRVLQTEGLVEGRFGRGVFVRDPRDRGTLHRGPLRRGEGSPFLADMAAQQRYGSWEAHSRAMEAPPGIAARLGLAAGGRVMRTHYTCLADRRPVQLSTSYEPLALTEGTAIAVPERGPHAGRGVVDRMAVIGVAVDRAQEVVGARLASRDEADALGTAAGVVVTVVERTHFAGGRPVETADIVVPANRWRVSYPVRVE